MTFRYRALVVGAALALGLTGCTASQADTEGPLTSSTTAPPSPLPTTVATTPAVPEVTATCDTVFTDDTYVTLDEDGLTFRGDASLDPELQSLVDAGGISCNWTRPSSDIMMQYAQWPSSQGAWDTLRAERLAAGYTEGNDPFPGIIQSELDPVILPSLTYRDGVVYYTSRPNHFSSVIALQ